MCVRVCVCVCVGVEKGKGRRWEGEKGEAIEGKMIEEGKKD